MSTIIRSASVACALALVLAACGGDDAETTSADDGAAETTSAADAETDEPTEAEPAADDGQSDADDEAMEDADAGSGDGDMIDAILRDLGLSGAVLSDGERSCVNDELATSVGTLPDDLSLNNTELWANVNAAAEACGAEIGL
ncbi:MAG: hypothetical protein AAF467_19265 [Actinomycetota bacterium]